MLEAILIFILILINGVFAMSEMALVSAKKLKLQQLEEQGSSGAKKALALLAHPNRLLAAVQVGITLVGVLTGAFGGKALSQPLSKVIDKISFLAPYSYAISFTIVIVLITYFSLVLGELVPKRIALSNPEKIAVSVSGLMFFVSKIASPFVSLLSVSMNVILAILGIKPKEEAVTEEEVAMLLAQATEEGVFEEAEQDIVENVFLLADRHVDSIMTARPEMIWFDKNTELEKLKEIIKEQPHSDYVIADGDLDKVIGILNLKDLILIDKIDLAQLTKDVHYVPETLPILKLLEHFKISREHIAVVVDEYGSVIGLVTAGDVLEALVGDLPDRGERSLSEMIEKLNENEYIVDGMLSLDDFRDYFDLKELPSGANKEFYTLNGFAMDRLEHIPNIDDHFEWQGFNFKIVEMADKRVAKIKLKIS